MDAGVHVLRGYPAREIAAFAERHDVQLIVQSFSGLIGTRRSLLGTVAEEIIRTAPCPVFTVKTLCDDTGVRRGVQGAQVALDSQPS